MIANRRLMVGTVCPRHRQPTTNTITAMLNAIGAAYGLTPAEDPMAIAPAAGIAGRYRNVSRTMPVTVGADERRRFAVPIDQLGSTVLYIDHPR